MIQSIKTELCGFQYHLNSVTRAQSFLFSFCDCMCHVLCSQTMHSQNSEIKVWAGYNLVSVQRLSLMPEDGRGKIFRNPTLSWSIMIKQSFLRLVGPPEGQATTGRMRMLSTPGQMGSCRRWSLTSLRTSGTGRSLCSGPPSLTSSPCSRPSTRSTRRHWSRSRRGSRDKDLR